MSSGEQQPDGPDLRQQRREEYRKQLLHGIGGWTGMVITAIPPVVFVVVNAVSELRPAIYAAIGSGVALAAYRVVRRQSIQQAVSGLVAVLIAAFIAARTGEARGYFLLGIWSSFAYAVPLAISILVRRPLVGVLWEYLDPAPGTSDTPWHRRRPLLRAYSLITAVATAVFLARGVVQLTLYGEHATGWLAFAKVAMGYPLYLVAVLFGLWYGSRVRRRLGQDRAHSQDRTHNPGRDDGQDAGTGGSADYGAADGGLGLR